MSNRIIELNTHVVCTEDYLDAAIDAVDARVVELIKRTPSYRLSELTGENKISVVDLQISMQQTQLKTPSSSGDKSYMCRFQWYYNIPYFDKISQDSHVYYHCNYFDMNISGHYMGYNMSGKSLPSGQYRKLVSPCALDNMNTNHTDLQIGANPGLNHDVNHGDEGRLLMSGSSPPALSAAARAGFFLGPI